MYLILAFFPRGLHGTIVHHVGIVTQCVFLEHINGHWDSYATHSLTNLYWGWRGRRLVFQSSCSVPTAALYRKKSLNRISTYFGFFTICHFRGIVTHALLAGLTLCQVPVWHHLCCKKGILGLSVVWGAASFLFEAQSFSHREQTICLV